jgi:L-alanine-DL-glutamate epimerase-like enolase superfamily enzyme
MRIKRIDAFGLRGATPKGGWSDELRRDDCVHTLVRVRSDDGRSGWGSAFTSEGMVQASLRELEPLYRGETCLEPARVTEKLHQHTFWMGMGGAFTHTISAIDIALWDLLGNILEQPVGRLLGGRFRDRVRPYASLLMEDPDRLAERLRAVCEQGFTAVKIGWGPFGRVDRRTDEAIVRAARDAVGPDVLLMVDAGGSDPFWPHGLKWALDRASMLRAYDVSWFEEPLDQDALEDFVRLRTAAPVPISGGETLTRRQAFRAWIVRGALDIVQPDVTKCGGLSECRRIAWLAEAFGVRYVPHGWNTAIGLAADLQLASALQGTDLVEYISGSPYVDELVDEPWALDKDGFLTIPEGPGLGIALRPDALARYAGWSQGDR